MSVLLFSYYSKWDGSLELNFFYGSFPELKMQMTNFTSQFSAMADMITKYYKIITQKTGVHNTQDFRRADEIS